MRFIFQSYLKILDFRVESENADCVDEEAECEEESRAMPRRPGIDAHGQTAQN